MGAGVGRIDRESEASISDRTFEQPPGSEHKNHRSPSVTVESSGAAAGVAVGTHGPTGREGSFSGASHSVLMK